MGCTVNQLPDQSFSFPRGDTFEIPFVVKAEEYPDATVVAAKFQLTPVDAGDGDPAAYSQAESVTIADNAAGELVLAFPVDGDDTDALATGQYDFTLRDTGRDVEIARGVVQLTAGERAFP